MSRIALFLASLCLASACTAQTVQTWTDEQGRVHFGDSRQAPRQSQALEIKIAPSYTAPPRPAPRLRPQSLPSPSKAPSSPKLPPDLALPGPPVCASLARELINTEDHQQGQRLTRQFVANCPNIAYDCETYAHHPERNRCQLIPRSGDQSITRHSWDSSL